jgi:ParB family chromosome partitioning protein
MDSHTDESKTTDPTLGVTLLPVEQLQPNDYNPNALSETEMAELIAEVHHLGRLPKPVVVRPIDAGYLIIDGEHGWRAAFAVGLAEVPCEVIAADDFEGMRQTYKRNQHGSNHPVRLGQMFRRMMAARDFSQRALASEIGVSEGTVRNALLYAAAADLRNDYAFEKLTVRQVRAYTMLPRIIADLWLACGADFRAFYGVQTEEEVKQGEIADPRSLEGCS